MKIFFALALVNYFTWYVVLGDGFNTVEENVSSVGFWGGTCQCPDGTTYEVGDNYDNCGTLACINGEKVGCNERNGEWSQRKVTCGDCGSGFSYTVQDLDGSTKEWPNPGEGIANCRFACLTRSGCTGFEYNHDGDEGYGCGTYTGLTSSFKQSDNQKSTWISCTKDDLKTGEECHDDSQCESGNCLEDCVMSNPLNLYIVFDCCL